jgi:hypothetical protein
MDGDPFGIGGMHRVRVGLIGLAWVFLLVAVATVVLRAAEERPTDNMSDVSVVEAPNDPLADLGVAPGNPVSGDTGPVQGGNATTTSR